MKLYELIADVILYYTPVSIEKLREWELLAIDQANAIESIDAHIVDQFQEFLTFHMGLDWYLRTITKFNEWKEKQ